MAIQNVILCFMLIDHIFSFAESIETHKLVHVDDVPKGLACNCICPHCKERLLARHGNINTHGFAHDSESRKANLEICFQVTCYKLAEQIIQENKYIKAPSYYTIFPGDVIRFASVSVDSEYEREDKQPDIIATGIDGRRYLIEFVFKKGIKHHKQIDLTDINLLEVDLSNQSLETIKTFLLESDEDRRWLNNSDLFNSIPDFYLKSQKARVKAVGEDECSKCLPRNHCFAPCKNSKPIIVENNNKKYRICKVEELQKAQESSHNIHGEVSYYSNLDDLAQKKKAIELAINILKAKGVTRCCYECQYNLALDYIPGKASCSRNYQFHTPLHPEPEYAKSCAHFEKK